MDNREKSGLRGSLRKLKDRWKERKALGQQAEGTIASTALNQAPTPTAQQVPRPAPAPAPDLLFKPTTQTIIHSPADPRNFQAFPSPLPRKPRSSSRRNTAPADFLSNNGAIPTVSSGTTALSANTVTTSITASLPRERRTSRLRLSFSKRSSVQPPQASPTFQRHPLVSPIPSATNTLECPKNRSTQAYAATTEMAARTKSVEEKPLRRDKPWERSDSGWNDIEEREEERVRTDQNEKGLYGAEDGCSGGKEEASDQAKDRPDVSMLTDKHNR